MEVLFFIEACIFQMQFIVNKTKLRASCAFVPYVPHVPTCLTCSRAIRACVHSCLCFLSAFLFYVPYVPSSFYVRSFFYVPYVSSFFLRALRALRAFIFLRALRVFYVPYVPSSFYVPEVASFLRVFTFLSVSNFWRKLCAFIFYIKCGTTHNQPQQIGISRNKVE